MPDIPDPIMQASQNALSAMSNSAFGSILGPVVDTQLLNLLGIGGSSALADYMSKIQAALSQIEGQLAQLQQSVATIVAAITEIKEQITEVNVERLLLDFNHNSVVVTQHFTLYQDALSGLTSSNPAVQKQGIAGLFDLLSLDNTTVIATAMTNIQQDFLPSLAELDGLIKFQNAVVQQAITARGSASDYWNVSSNPNDSVPITNPAGQIGTYNGYGLFANSQGAATDALNGVVVDTFRAFVTVSIQGLILLNAGWLNSIYENEVQKQVDGINKVLAAMVDFGKQIVGVVDQQVAANLKTYGKPLGGPAAQGQYNWDYGRGNVQPGNPVPFGADWIQWQSDTDANHPQTIPFLIQAPWDYGNNIIQLWYYHGWDKIVVRTEQMGWINSTGPAHISRYNPATPDKLNAFLAPLAAVKAAQR